MRTLLIIVFVIVSQGLWGQNQTQIVSEGDQLTLIVPENGQFQHLKFPRKNIILKRGAIANFKAIHKVRLKVVAIKEDAGRRILVLERVDGRPFFRFWNRVQANFPEAINQGELIRS